MKEFGKKKKKNIKGSVCKVLKEVCLVLGHCQVGCLKTWRQWMAALCMFSLDTPSYANFLIVFITFYTADKH